ncbi:MAG: sensor histidine kinase [Aggregatilineales bacterium]
MTDISRTPESNLLVRNRMLAAEIQRRVNQLSAINTVAAVISQSRDLHRTLETALDSVLSVIPVEASGISLIDDAAGELVMRAQRGWKRDFVTTPMRIKLGHGMSGLVVANNEVVISGDISKDPRLVVPAVAEEQFQAMAMAPMHARSKVIGVLSVMSNLPYTFNSEEIEVLCAIADQVGVALDNARLYESTREQQNRLAAVLQSTADAIIATDDQRRVTVINEAAERLFNLNAAQVVGQLITDLPLELELREGLAAALAAPPDGSARTFDLTLRNDVFLSVIISAVSAPSRLEDRQFNGYVMVFQNVTHLKQAERARLEFIQTAAHDLRNPLGVTLSALTLLNRSWHNPTATEREIIDIAMRGLNRMQDLIDDLLHLEKLESGLDFHPDWCDVAEVVVGCGQDISPALERRNQQLQVEIAPDLPRVYADARWLTRALANLLTNANKYTPEGGVIVLRALIEEGELRIEVADNGPGIPLDAQSRLFERFYRVQQTEDSAPGTGLGLAIVKSVADLHHGHVAVESAPGQGSCFRLALPLALAETVA